MGHTRHIRHTADSVTNAQVTDLQRDFDGALLREHRLDPEAVSWLQTNFLKTELELGHCLRTPAEGPCECDLILTCSKFLTTSDYSPRLRARMEVEQRLIDDATVRGWPREIERHEATKRRLQQLLHDLG